MADTDEIQALVYMSAIRGRPDASEYADVAELCMQAGDGEMIIHNPADWGRRAEKL